MSEQDLNIKELLASHNPTSANPVPLATEKVPPLETPRERKQWMSDLQTQLELSAQAALTCRRIDRR